jgi:aspartyl-tRNA(Asn)/glutamyl-tRNA(Gln) amidotransferase subunit B
MGASEKEAEMFVENTTLSQYFSALIGLTQNDKKKVRIALNYILSDYLGALKKKFGEQNSIQKMDTVTPIQFIELINMLYSNEINSKSAKEIIQIMIDDGGTPREIATKKNLLQTNDQESVKKIVKDVLSQNPKVVDDYRGGKQASLQFLMGQALKITKGSASPDLIRTLLIDALK